MQWFASADQVVDLTTDSQRLVWFFIAKEVTYTDAKGMADLVRITTRKTVK